MDEKNSMSQNNNIIQNIILENRERLTVTGVIDVLSFDDLIIIIETQLGLLTIKGYDLRINKLNLDNSEIIVEGEVQNMGYSEENNNKNKTSFLGKIFK